MASYYYSGTIGDDVIHGSAYDDAIYGGPTHYSSGYSYNNGEGRDTLYGEGGNDELYGGENADKLIGGAGNDILNGGSGNDEYQFSGNFGQDLVREGYGDSNIVSFLDLNRSGVSIDFDDHGLFITNNATSDRVAIENYDSYKEYFTIKFLDGNFVDVPTEGKDTILGGWGDDTIDALGDNDTVYGGYGNDRLTGGTGNDTLYGDEDNDTLIGGLGNDLLNGGTGIDAAYYGGATAIIADLSGTTDTVRLGTETDTLTSIENVIGTRAADSFKGDGNANMFMGGDGKDTYTSGGGHDTFDFNTSNDSRVGFSVRDVITDFAHLSDKVDLAGIDAETSRTGDQAFHWVGSAAFHNAHPGELGYFLSGSFTVIHGSTDGDSADEFQIQLTGHPTLAATDFVL